MSSHREDPSPATLIRLVVTDIDGTLVDPSKRLTARTIEAAHALAHAGITLCLVSSRPTRGMKVLRDQLGIETPLAGFNGGQILSGDGRELESLTVPEAPALLAVEMLTTHGIDVWMFADDEWFLTDETAAYVPLERRTLGFEPKIVRNFDQVIGRANKILGSSIDHHLLERMETEMMTGLGSSVAAHRSQDYYLDITHPRARKDHALRALARLFDIDVGEVAALGDMPNDLSMLGVAGLSIAMANGPTEVQEAAMFVTASNADEGWAKAVEDIILPRAVGAN